ncbi:MAG TPA: hypothetical protein VFE47_29165 [Tepidisphaeraceae bacterium]|jgi:hypothetical protein|nr:hypothetical protein [Tepidisphaeraceae bacterium]
MRYCNVRSIVGALALVLSAGMAQAANSPVYDSWAKLKPGSSVTVHTVSEAAGQKSEMEMTYVLDEVQAEKVVIEVKTSMLAPAKMELPARKQDIPRGTAATPTTPAAPSAPATPTPNVKQSEESVTIAGKAFKCKVTEATNDQSGMKTASKTWTCPEMPNMLVKMEASTTGTVASKATMQVTKVDLK